MIMVIYSALLGPRLDTVNGSPLGRHANDKHTRGSGISRCCCIMLALNNEA